MYFVLSIYILLLLFNLSNDFLEKCLLGNFKTPKTKHCKDNSHML